MMPRLVSSLGFAILLASPLAAATAAPEQAARRFAELYLPYAPGSTIEVRITHNGSTSAGGYLALTATRAAGKKDGRGEQIGLLVDPQAKTVAAGYVVPLQPASAVASDALPAYAEQVVSQFMQQAMSVRVRVRWPGIPSRPTAVVPLTAEVSTGFGWMKMPIALSADGRWLAIGASWPLERDPRDVRREILAQAPITWDSGPANAPLKLVEFSDFQCPACKRGWGEIEPIISSFGGTLRHGFAHFPLTSNHPWAFRASVAGACLTSAAPELLVPFKKYMYELQSSLTVETVDDAVFGFLGQHGLDEKSFRDCYMKDKAIDAVIAHMELGHRVGVTGTPAYFANGEQLGYGDTELMEQRLRALLGATAAPPAAGKK